MEMGIIGLDKLLGLIEIICFLVADATHPWSELSGYRSFIYLTHIIFKHNSMVIIQVMLISYHHR